MMGNWKHRGNLLATKQFVGCVSKYHLCGQNCRVVEFLGFFQVLCCRYFPPHAGIAKLLESRFILNTTVSTLWVVPLDGVGIFKMQLLCGIRSLTNFLLGPLCQFEY